ncbi:pseudouridine synthase [Reichenbachiella carrageenanivorans]|uniref:tRNA pseudouridine synthase C n=1 Tax=Reichenbachiella carrageenanivorans TaxID=2979869 RepID=A0ABY6CWF1_9BACT|nr:pseudouridine synthase [Reichenbachiella carrageenanivorans]UXX78235.1 pseudouridine synthase [Reichenbachiella carrageenanivorans]
MIEEKNMSAAKNLEILFQDEHYVAINKPHGLLVHRSKIATNTDEFAVQQLRDQLGQHVHPAHRLDRKTSGVLLFALSKEALTAIRATFENEEMEKRYWSILRGYTEPEGLIDYPLTNDKGKNQEAQTAYTTLNQTEVEVPFGKHPTSRYSWVEARPKTGRMHQLRKHFAHIFHPIIGDRPHGCNKQNKLFLDRWQMGTMLLHAVALRFIHPITKTEISISAQPQSEFIRMIDVLKFDKNLLA